MRYPLELMEQIESVREKLDAAVQDGVEGTECYQLSLRLDKLIADYMQLTDKVQLRNCS